MKHRALKKLGLINHDIVKIWFDEELLAICAFVNARSGLYNIPTKHSINIKNSEWLASFSAWTKYGEFKGSTIYILIDIKE